MSECFRELSNEQLRKEASILMHLTATHNPSAVQRFQRLCECGIFQDVERQMGFSINWEHRKRCDCWFELEYCDYRNETSINETMLDEIRESIIRGKCRHVTDKVSHKIDKEKLVTSVGYVHIAAGCDNEQVLEFLLKLDKRKKLEPSKHCLLPLHIAILKSSQKTISMLLDRKYKARIMDSPYMFRVETCSVLWTSRNKDSGDVEVVEFHKASTNIPKILYMVDNPSDSLLRLVFPVLELDQIGRLLDDFINSKRGKLVQRILAIETRPINQLDPNLLFLCDFVDDNDALKTLITRGVQCNRVKYGYNILDVAEAFGSTKCVAVLKSTTTLSQTQNVCQSVSPYAFLFKIAGNPSYRLRPWILQRCMIELKARGHDINQRDRDGATPLHHMITSYLEYNPGVVKTFLSLGADINVIERQNGFTPLMLALERGGKKGFVKDILAFNPIIRNAQLVMKTAAQRDVETSSLLKHLSLATAIKFKASATDDTQEAIKAGTDDDKMLALSFVALLYELGYEMDPNCNLRFLGDIGNLEPVKQYLERKASRPRSLQSVCRLALRKACCGHEMHIVKDQLIMPNQLHNYVFMPYFLRYVEVETESPGGWKETIYADGQQ